MANKRKMTSVLLFNTCERHKALASNKKKKGKKWTHTHTNKQEGRGKKIVNSLSPMTVIYQGKQTQRKRSVTRTLRSCRDQRDPPHLQILPKEDN